MYYHGTARQRGSSMIKKKHMEYSRGDDQWLGDGIYLYKDKLYAFRWIEIKYKEYFEKELISDKLFMEYMILGVNIDYDYEAVFSFFNPEHILEFKEVKKKCENMKGKSAILQKCEFTDGVLINLMFKNLNYGETYDMVEAAFPIGKCIDETSTRLLHVNEYQLCIKNPKKIIDFCDRSLDFEYKVYHEKLNKFNEYRTRSKEKYKVNARRRGDIYET